MSRQHPLLPAPLEAAVVFRPLKLSGRSRFFLWLLRTFLKP